MARGKQTRRTRCRLLHSRWAQAAAGLVLWAGGDSLSGQAAQPPEHGEIVQYYLNKQTIQLPIQLDEQFRPILQEIRLYSKENLSAPWVLQDKATPKQTTFTFRAPHDGEYWFMMVTVDREGRCAPSDITKEEPALAVVVDTQPPQAEVTMLGNTAEGHLIQCDVHDAHLDTSRTRVQYQTADKVYRDLERMSDRSNVYCIPAQANITGQIRVISADQAGNQATRECNLAQLPANKTAASALVPKPTSSGAAEQKMAEQKLSGPQLVPASGVGEAQPANVAPVVNAAPPANVAPVVNVAPPVVNAAPPANVAPVVNTAPPANVAPVVNAAPAANAAPVAPMSSAEKLAPKILPGNLSTSPNLGTSPGVSTTTAVMVPQGPPLPSGPVPGNSAASIQKTEMPAGPQFVHTEPALPIAPPAAPNMQPATTTAQAQMPTVQPTTIAAKHDGMPVHHLLVNNTRVFLEYRIEQAGASGVGKVEVWCTRDKGQSWQKISEDRDRQSPAEVNLPGDGVYGLTLVVSNGLGFGAQPPIPGDTPDWWIEVDTTQPVAQITSVRLSTDDGPAVHIGWTSMDKNLGSGPVDLSYAVSRNGPWVAIAKGLKGDGQFRWVPPLDIGAQGFFRLTVRDLASNTTITETTQPVALDDLSRPHAVMTGISTDSTVTPVSAPKNNAH